VRTLPHWQVHRLATGHCPMVSEPAALAALLLEIAADPGGTGPAPKADTDPG
jgi:hypothetical protein